ncbi:MULTISPECIES: hypothetical protein [unclassified Aureimonas]|uniref:hypothetical protein n=1 Tax=unclassified Aureimonas TaxID=2615206 RepID=UPI0006FE303F|nr:MULTISPECIES: hypothetical protein [unclassified Aureimonas]KQT60364.1 hypothetical protein ASG62_06820 [Aureimonas sp. Leaf427]KQT79242.1 hypothetical protein ASG54_09420 [Aureimonas sp. Leaf460]
MDINELIAPIALQEEGSWLKIYQPDGELTDIEFLVAGPDSERQRKGRFQTIERFANKVDRRGNMAAEDNEAMTIDLLARSVIDWKGLEDGDAPFECTHENVVKMLQTVPWLRIQVDVHAASRLPYQPAGRRAAEAEAAAVELAAKAA